MGPATRWGNRLTKQEISEKRRAGCDDPAIHVDGVAHALERVEGDADRQHDVQQRQRAAAESVHSRFRFSAVNV